MVSIYTPLLDEMLNPGRESQMPLYIPLPPTDWKQERRELPNDLEKKILIIDPDQEDEGIDRGVVIIDLYSSCEEEYLL